jgi:hypothetical protein
MVPHDEQIKLLLIAGLGSRLHKKHGVYLDFVTVTSYPVAYEKPNRDVPRDT